MRITKTTTEKDILEKLEEIFFKCDYVREVSSQEDEDGDFYFDDEGFFIMEDIPTHWKKDNFVELLYRAEERATDNVGRIKFVFDDGEFILYCDGNFYYSISQDGRTISIDNSLEVVRLCEKCLREGQSFLEKKYIVNANGVLVKYVGANDKDITIPDEVVEIGPACFERHLEIEQVCLPSQLRAVRFAAFRFCSGLKKITIPDSCNILGSHMFVDCESLKEVRLQKGCREIPECMFYGCCNLETITGINIDSIVIGERALEGTPLQEKYVHNAE